MNKTLIAASIPIMITACGGGGGSTGSGNPATAVGQFKDANTAGLSYVSGGQSGVTGSDGSFTYEVGSPVTFSIGGVTLGSTDGKSVVTPIDLVPGSSSSSTKVKNIVRFLLMLDDNGDPTDGINITKPVQDIAKSWSNVDFATPNLQADLTSIISDAASVSGGTHSLPSAATAQAHMESTFLCSYAGAFKGSFSGDDSGTFGVLVDASGGSVNGVGYSVPFQEFMTLSGTTPIAAGQKNVAFTTGNVSTGATFSGKYTSVNGLSGTWNNSTDNSAGSFSGSRIGGATNAAYRFTGQFSNANNTDYGLLSFDVDGSNSVTGVGYEISSDKLFTLSGSVTGTTLSATTSDGVTTITGTLNTATGNLSGTWSDAPSSNAPDTGTFAGSGCKLN